MIAFANIIAKLVTISAPFVNELKEPTPMIIASICLIICIFNSFFINVEVDEDEFKNDNVDNEMLH